MNWTTRISVLMDAGAVRRCHTVRWLADYTVAAHVYGAQCIAVELCALNQVAAGAVCAYLLYHDAPELLTGDIPAPTKRALSHEAQDELEELEAQFYRRVGIHPVEKLTSVQLGIGRAADVFDLCYAALYERENGNAAPAVERVFRRALSYVAPYTKIKGVQALQQDLATRWEKGSAYDYAE